MRQLVAFLVLLTLTAPAAAHSTEEGDPHRWWTMWSTDPFVIVPLVLAAILYLAGWARLAGRGAEPVAHARVALFWSGWAAAFVALISPVDPMGEFLFSAHMIQHELLMTLAAPLLVSSRPAPVFMLAFPPAWRRRLARILKVSGTTTAWRCITGLWVAFALQTAALWLWHMPGLFQTAVENDAVHTAQHLSFFGTAILFWTGVSDRATGNLGAAILALFATGAQTAILGALLTLSAVPWYPVYAATAPEWGLSLMEDQQIGGLIMWVPGCLPYVFAALSLFARLLGPRERRAL